MHDTDLKKELLKLHKEREDLMIKVRAIDKIISAKLGISVKHVKKRRMTSEQFLAACS